MPGNITPWTAAEDRAGQTVKVVGYGLMGAGLMALGAAFHRIKAFSTMSPRALRAVQGSLIAAGALSEVAAIASAVSGHLPPKKEAAGSTALSSGSAEKLETKKTLYQEMRSKKPDLEVIDRCCKVLGEAINEPWGSDVNPNEREDTPLHEAIYVKNEKIIRRLVKAGARINEPGHRGQTPFYLALTVPRKPEHENLQDSIVKLFLKQGARLPSMDNTSPLVGSYSFRGSIQKQLKEQHATDLELLERVKAGDTKAVKELLEAGYPVNVWTEEDPAKRTPLQYAVLSGDVDLVACILKYHPKLEHTDKAGRTALELAAEPAEGEPNLEIVKLLIDAGANPLCDIYPKRDPLAFRLSDNEELFPLLMKCVWKQQRKELKALGAFTKVQPQKKCSLRGKKKRQAQKSLLAAITAEKPNIKAITRLARQLGALVNEPLKKKGLPPAALAIEAGKPAVLNALLRGGADPNLTLEDFFDDDGTAYRGCRLYHFALHLSRDELQEEHVQALIQHGAFVPIDLDERFEAQACISGVPRLMRQSLIHHQFVRAAAKGDEDSVERYLKAGFEVDARSQWTGAALWEAVGNGQHGIVKRLLKAGANARQTHWLVDETLLDCALRPKKGEPSKAMIELLLKAGAQPDYGPDRWLIGTPIAYAKCLGVDTGIIELMKSYLPAES